ncbi:MAG: penicillin-binding protein 2, partial [Deltaproteobacteria bacterium]
MNITRKKKADGRRVRLRILLVGCFFSLLYLAVVARAVYIQAFHDDVLARRALREYRKTYVTTGKRGTIYDRNGMEMAVTIDTESIGLHPAYVRDKHKAAVKLAAALGMETALVKGRLLSNRPFVWLKRHVSSSEVEAVRALGLKKAVEFVPEQDRVYPNRTLAAQVIGFVGVDGNGLEGLEYEYNRELKGESIRRTVVRDATGGSFYADSLSEASINGNSLVLTIDGTIQCITETVLKETAEQYEAGSGMAVVMDPRSGEILAMVNYPFFNPNNFSAYDRVLWRNRVVTDAF